MAMWGLKSQRAGSAGAQGGAFPSCSQPWCLQGLTGGPRVGGQCLEDLGLALPVSLSMPNPRQGPESLGKLSEGGEDKGD